MIATGLQPRCDWAVSDPLMRAYHDHEWGVPVRDSRLLWETLMLEGFQAGLAWIIVLRKRDAFRAAFSDFDPSIVANYGELDIARLMEDSGIIRSKGKIEATIRGAQIFCEMESQGESFSDFCWSFTDGKSVRGDGQSWATSSPLSERISKELKAKGFKYVGATITYAWMQAVGLVNDHSQSCFRRSQVATTPSAQANAQQVSHVLTEREREILRYISQGATNKEAARLLTISQSTVRTHMENIFRKLGCSTRAAATLKASTLGLIT